MGNLEQLLHIGRAAKESGLDKAERRRLIEGGNDYINEIIKRSHPEKESSDRRGQYFQGEEVRNIEKFFDFMEGDEKRDEAGLSLGAVLRKYGSKERRPDRERLTQEEGALVTLAIKYFENWFYSKGFLREFKSEWYRNDYYAISAFIINQLAKIKELSENKDLVQGMDGEKLDELISKVEIFAQEYMSKDKLTAQVKEIEAKKAPLASELALLKKKAAPFEKKAIEISSASWQDYSKVMEKLEGSLESLPLSQVEKKALSRLKAILEEPEHIDEEYPYPPRKKEMWNELSNRNGSFMEILRMKIRRDMDTEGKDGKEKRKKLIDELDKIESLLKERLNKQRDIKKEALKNKTKKLSGFTALAGLKEAMSEDDFLNFLEGLVGNLYDKARADIEKQMELRAKAVSMRELHKNEDAIRDLNYELNKAREILFQRDKILEALQISMVSIRESLKKPAGDLYFLKTIIIAAAEQARRNQSHLDFRPDSAIDKADRKDMVFDFSDASRSKGNGGYGDYKKVHYEPSHIPFAQFAVKYMKSQHES